MAAASAAGFCQQTEGVGNFGGSAGRELQALALPALDLNQLTKLAKVIGRARAEGKSLEPLVPFRLCAMAVLAVWEWLRALLLSVKTSEGLVLTSRYARVICATALGLVALVITVLLNQPAPDIVYKAF